LKSDTLKLIFGFGAGTIRITGDNGDAVAEDVIFLAPMRKRVNRVRRVRDVK
jgi:hypothetical protein